MTKGIFSRCKGAGNASRTRLLAVLACVIILGIGGFLAWRHARDRYWPAEDVQVVLLGETHGQGYDRELEVWEEYYRQGSRDLFVESPYYTAQYLNLWMQSDDDEILDEVYADLEGTAAHNEGYLSFLRQVKSRCPETVFHGTDVGHQFDTTGERYLAYAEERYGASSEEVARTKETIGQGRRYYEDDCDESYREAQMVANFEQAYDDIRSSGTAEVVVGIYGSAHADPRARSWSGEEDCMAKQLKGRYGDVIAYERVS